MANLELKEELSFEEFSRYFDKLLKQYGLEESQKIQSDRIKLYNKYRFVIFHKYRDQYTTCVSYPSPFVSLIATYFTCLTSNNDVDKFYELDVKLGLTPQRIKPNKN